MQRDPASSSPPSHMSDAVPVPPFTRPASFPRQAAVAYLPSPLSHHDYQFARQNSQQHDSNPYYPSFPASAAISQSSSPVTSSTLTQSGYPPVEQRQPYPHVPACSIPMHATVPPRTSSSRGAPAVTSSRGRPTDVVIPQCPQTFEQLQSMPSHELLRLLRDEVAFDDFIREHPYRVRIERTLNTLREQIEERKRQNNLKREELSRIDTSTSDRTLEEQLAEEQERLRQAQHRFQDWFSRNSTEALTERLREAVEDVRLQSEELSESFFAGDIPYADFIQQYTELRKSYHERKIKLGYLSQSMNRPSD